MSEADGWDDIGPDSMATALLESFFEKTVREYERGGLGHMSVSNRSPAADPGRSAEGDPDPQGRSGGRLGGLARGCSGGLL